MNLGIALKSRHFGSSVSLLSFSISCDSHLILLAHHPSTRETTQKDIYASAFSFTMSSLDSQVTEFSNGQAGEFASHVPDDFPSLVTNPSWLTREEPWTRPILWKRTSCVRAAGQLCRSDERYIQKCIPARAQSSSDGKAGPENYRVSVALLPSGILHALFCSSSILL